MKATVLKAFKIGKTIRTPIIIMKMNFLFFLILGNIAINIPPYAPAIPFLAITVGKYVSNMHIRLTAKNLRYFLFFRMRIAELVVVRDINAVRQCPKRSPSELMFVFTIELPRTRFPENPYNASWYRVNIMFTVENKSWRFLIRFSCPPP